MLEWHASTRMTTLMNVERFCPHSGPTSAESHGDPAGSEGPGASGPDDQDPAQQDPAPSRGGWDSPVLPRPPRPPGPQQQFRRDGRRRPAGPHPPLRRAAQGRGRPKDPAPQDPAPPL